MITVFLSLYRKDMWDYYSRTGEIKKKKKKKEKMKKRNSGFNEKRWIQTQTHTQ